MAKTVLICGKIFDGLGDTLRGPTEILIEDDAIAEVSESVGRPEGAPVIDHGTDCGMFPFSHGILEFQAMVAAGLPLADISVTTKVDFVMKAGRVYRHGSYDILQ
ncbi:hypothetical protein [Microvirga sp. 2TAF3]|uniref:hypothetical protein n=1 Tax=Microvirga sp. 2TAF3 TaxID=3233014 RepID=UPI003F9CB7A7